MLLFLTQIKVVVVVAVKLTQEISCAFLYIYFAFMLANTSVVIYNNVVE